MAKSYTVEKKIGNTTYIAQFSGLSTALRAVDNSYIEGTNNTSLEKLAKYLFEYVIVEPKGLTVDDFESLDEFNEVTSFGRSVMQGELKPETDKKAKD